MWEQLIAKSDGGALGPEIIDLFMQLNNKRKSHNLHFATCSLFENMNTDYTPLIEYFDKHDLFTVDKLFIPINFNNTWVLVITFIKDLQIDYYDPLNNDGDEVTKKFKNFMKELIKKRKHSFKEIRKSSFRSQSVKTITHKDTLPRTTNESDTGVYILGYIHTLVNNIDFNPSKIRSDVALEMLNLINHFNPLDPLIKNVLTQQVESMEFRNKEVTPISIPIVQSDERKEKKIKAVSQRERKSKKTPKKFTWEERKSKSARRSTTVNEKNVIPTYSPPGNKSRSKSKYNPTIEEEQT